MAIEGKSRKITASEATSKLIRTILKMPADKIIDLLNEVEEKQHLNKREPRVPYSAEVTFAVNERFYTGYISNINGNGIFIETENRFDPGDKLTLSFESPGGENHIKITGEIVRANEEGIGISFDENIQEMLELSEGNRVELILYRSDAGEKANKGGTIRFS